MHFQSQCWESRQEDLQDSLASQPRLLSEILASKDPVSFFFFPETEYPGASKMVQGILLPSLMI